MVRACRGAGTGELPGTARRRAATTVIAVRHERTCDFRQPGCQACITELRQREPKIQIIHQFQVPQAGAGFIAALNHLILRAGRLFQHRDSAFKRKALSGNRLNSEEKSSQRNFAAFAETAGDYRRNRQMLEQNGLERLWEGPSLITVRNASLPGGETAWR